MFIEFGEVITDIQGLWLEKNEDNGKFYIGLMNAYRVSTLVFDTEEARDAKWEELRELLLPKSG